MSDGESASPNRSQALVVWGLGTTFLGLGLLTAVMFGVLAEQVREQLGVSDNAIGLLSAVYYLAYSAAQFVGGILLDRFNPGWVLRRLLADLGGGLLAARRRVEPGGHGRRRGRWWGSGCRRAF